MVISHGLTAPRVLDPAVSPAPHVVAPETLLRPARGWQRTHARTCRRDAALSAAGLELDEARTRRRWRSGCAARPARTQWRACASLSGGKRVARAGGGDNERGWDGDRVGAAASNYQRHLARHGPISCSLATGVLQASLATARLDLLSRCQVRIRASCPLREGAEAAGRKGW